MNKQHLNITAIIVLILSTLSIGLQQCTPPAKLAAMDMIDLSSNNPAWKEIDSLIAHRQFQSAEKLRLEMETKALAQDDRNAYILSRWKYYNSLTENRTETISSVVHNARTEIQSAGGIEKSLLAMGYSSWLANTIFSELAGSIGERTDVQNLENNPDQWSIHQWHQELREYLYKTVTYAAAYNQPSGKFELLIKPGENTPWYGENIFDLIALEVIQILENGQLNFDQISPAEAQRSEKWFELPADQGNLFSDNMESNLALLNKVYNNLLGLLADGNRTDVFLDINLRRLQWVHRNSLHPDKDNLFTNQLTKKYFKYNNSPVAGDYAAAMAEWHMGKVNWQAWSYADDSAAIASNYAHKDSMVHWLNFAKAYESNVRSSKLSAFLEKQLLEQNLAITSESVYQPGENMLMLLTYRNIPEVHARIYKLPSNAEITIPNDWKESRDFLNQFPIIDTYHWVLSSADDHFEHRTEAVLKNHGLGRYVIVAGNDSVFSNENAAITLSDFYVSNIAITSRREAEQTEFRILSRDKGMPIAQVELTISEAVYSRHERRFDLIEIEKIYTNVVGTVSYARRAGQSFRVRVVYEGDTLISNDHFYAHAPHFSGRESEPEVVFLTDRSLYRAGQKLWFKGLIIERDRNSVPKIKAGQTLTVNLHDVNNQIIATSSFQSDRYGTIHGSFPIPENVLNGVFSLRADISGQKFVRVEDYRPPGFEIILEEQAESYHAGDVVEVCGQVEYYSGLPVADALVRYEINRQRWPIWGRGFFPPPGRGASVFIEAGETSTDSDGQFKLTFEIPEKASGQTGWPWHESYEVKISIQDLSGEVQEKSTIIRAGTQPVILHLDVPELHLAGQELNISGENKLASGQLASASHRIRISKLLPPENLWKKRLWEMPNQHLLSKTEYEALLPGRSYKADLNPDNWEVDRVIKDTTISAEQFNIQYSEGSLQAGFYRIEATMENENQPGALQKHHLMVISPEQAFQSGLDDVIVQASQPEVKPGESVDIFWVFPPHIEYYRLELSHNGKLLDYVENNAGFDQMYKLDVTNQHRGNVQYHLIAVADGRIYSHTGQLKVPWSDKALQISWLDFEPEVKPGQKGNWVLQIKDHIGKPVQGQLALSAYDASLDALHPHDWKRTFFPQYQGLTGFRGADFEPIFGYMRRPSSYYESIPMEKLNFQYPGLNTGFDFLSYRYEPSIMLRGKAMSSDAVLAESASPEVAAMAIEENASEQAQEEAMPEIRMLFEPLSVFEATLESDANGVVQVPYHMQESLTRWRVLGFVHTQDLQYHFFENLLHTRKEVSLECTWPRFLYAGDELILSAKVSNATNIEVRGIAAINFYDKLAEHQPDWLDTQTLSQRVVVPPNSTVYLEWPLNIPRDFSGLLETEAVFTAENHSDGERRIIPVLSLMDSSFFTGSMGRLEAGEEKAFKPVALNEIRSNPEVKLDGFSIEITSNPAWIALKALPATKPEMDAPTTEIATYYGALFLAQYIKNAIPNIEEVLAAWAADSSALLSELDKNPELKATTLEMTPWVFEAERERIQRQSIVALFESLQSPAYLTYWRTQLQNRQLSSGGFSWLQSGMESTFNTTYVVELIGILHEKQMTPTSERSALLQMMRQAIRYLDIQMQLEYNHIKEIAKQKPDEMYITARQIHQFYARSMFYNFPIGMPNDGAHHFYKSQIIDHIHKFPVGVQANAALALHKNDVSNAKRIASYLREQSTKPDNNTMFWQQARGYQWHEQSLVAHAAVMLALNEIENNTQEQYAMAQWLINHKQTNAWNDRNGSLKALIALLSIASDQYEESSAPELSINGQKIDLSSAEAGSGQAYLHFTEADLDDGEIMVNIINKGTMPLWYSWQVRYRTPMDQVEAAGSEILEIEKYLLKGSIESGQRMFTKSETFRKSNQLMIRLYLKVDRPMSYVHIRDNRAAGFEPAILQSGYHFAEGISYYLQSTDTHTDIFIAQLRAGEYIIEYPLHIFHAGQFSAGHAQIQSYYAPYISSHTSGKRISVQE